MDEMYLRYKSTAVFAETAKTVSPLAELLRCADSAERAELAARVFRAVAESGCDTTGEWIKSCVLAEDNYFTRAAARGERIPDRTKAQVRSELLMFKQLSLYRPEEFSDETNRAFFPMFGFGGFSLSYDRLAAFYAANGYGALACGNMFILKDGELVPTETDGISISDLKGYAEEKAELIKNTENFINGLPSFHTLVYGDRGTGKTATVRAIANEYKNRLKVIELSRYRLGELQGLIKKLGGLKQKIIIFIDNIDMKAADDTETLRAALDDALSPARNVLLYCTADRITEHSCGTVFANAKPHADDLAELALFDRFGLVVTYITPDKDGFTDILKQILRSRSIKWRDEYAPLSELAAMKKGGCTPRAAKQIADLIETVYAEKRCG